MNRNGDVRNLSSNQKFLQEKRIIEYVKLEKNIEENCQKAFALIFRQCTYHMKSKLEAHEDYHRMRGDYNVLLFVGYIKGLNFKFDGHMHPSHNLHDSKRDFYQYYQTRQTKNPKYLDTSKNKVLVTESYGGVIGNDPGLVKEELAGVANLIYPDKQASEKPEKRKHL